MASAPAKTLVMLCPNEDCGQKYRIKSTLAGQKVKCSRCGEKFVIGGKAAPKDDALEPATVPLKPIESAQGPRQAVREDTKAKPAETETAETEAEAESSQAEADTETAETETAEQEIPAAKEPARPRAATMTQEKAEGAPKVTRFVFPALAVLVSAGVVWSAVKSIKESKAHAAAVQTSSVYKKKQALAKSFQKQAEEPEPADSGDTEPTAAIDISLATVKSEQALIQREGAEPFLVRRGQPVVVWGDGESGQRVEVFLPEQRVSGQIDAADLQKADGEISVNDLLGFVKHPEEAPGAIHSLTFRADGGLVTALATESHGQVLEVPSGRVVRNLDSSASSAAFMPDGSLLIASRLGGKVWDGQTTATLARLKDSKGSLLPLKQAAHALEFSTAGLKLWDIQQAKILKSNASSCEFVRISKDGANGVLISSTGDVTLFSLPGLKVEKTQTLFATPADFDYSFDTQTFAVASAGQPHVTIGQVGSEDSSRAIDVHREVTGIRFLSRGRYLAVATKGSRAIQVFDLQKNRIALVGVPENSPISAMEIGPDGLTAALGHANGKVRFLKLDEDELTPAFAQYDREFLEPIRRKEKAIYSRFRNALLNRQKDQAAQYVAELKAKFPDGEYAARAEKDLEKPPATAGTQTGPKTTPSTLKMPDNPRTLYNFFYGFLVNKKKKEAMQYYDHLLKTYPDSEFAEKAKEQLEIYRLKNQ